MTQTQIQILLQLIIVIVLVLAIGFVSIRELHKLFRQVDKSICHPGIVTMLRIIIVIAILLIVSYGFYSLHNSVLQHIPASAVRPQAPADFSEKKSPPIKVRPSPPPNAFP